MGLFSVQRNVQLIACQKKQDVSLLAWNNDGKNGKDDPNHSERVVV